MKRNGNRLSRDERHEMMDKIMVIARDRLIEHKRNGIKFKQIANELGVPKTRISEVLNCAYAGKRTINMLIQHRYLTANDIEMADLTELQRVTALEYFPAMKQL